MGSEMCIRDRVYRVRPGVPCSSYTRARVALGTPSAEEEEEENAKEDETVLGSSRAESSRGGGILPAYIVEKCGKPRGLPSAHGRCHVAVGVANEEDDGAALARRPEATRCSAARMPTAVRAGAQAARRGVTEKKRKEEHPDQYK